jgi:hypothetical protein
MSMSSVFCENVLKNLGTSHLFGANQQETAWRKTGKREESGYYHPLNKYII